MEAAAYAAQVHAAALRVPARQRQGAAAFANGVEIAAVALHVSVRDNIVPMPADVLLRIFAPAIDTPPALLPVYAALLGAGVRKGPMRSSYTIIELAVVIAGLHILCRCSGVGTDSSVGYVSRPPLPGGRVFVAQCARRAPPCRPARQPDDGSCTPPLSPSSPALSLACYRSHWRVLLGDIADGGGTHGLEDPSQAPNADGRRRAFLASRHLAGALTLVKRNGAVGWALGPRAARAPLDVAAEAARQAFAAAEAVHAAEVAAFLAEDRAAAVTEDLVDWDAGHLHYQDVDIPDDGVDSPFEPPAHSPFGADDGDSPFAARAGNADADSDF